VDRDLTKGKITLPIIRLIQSTPKKQRPALSKFIVRQSRCTGILPTIVGSKSLRSNCHTITTNTIPAKKQRLAQLLTESHSLAYAYAQINNYVTLAKICLDPLPDLPDKQSLIRLADNILLH
jgi:geranylgeranyl pyrophosphate synthase